MKIFEFAIALWVAAGLLGFSVWSVYYWTKNDVAVYRKPGLSAVDRVTSAAIYWSGALVIWMAALLLAGAVFGLAAQAAWRLVGG